MVPVKDQHVVVVADDFGEYRPDETDEVLVVAPQAGSGYVVGVDGNLESERDDRWIDAWFEYELGIEPIPYPAVLGTL
ncbi:MAG: hypothetical protein QOJ20_3565 [Mycobacterium sp.]|jgi:hypothetical protein|nr:hypothetical protein [Mycobacterium sp.]MDT5282370.1 hypothetical protein [Mycobacterium sp.]